jgi:hypothetical protein
MDINNRFECLIDDNYRRKSGRLPLDNRFSCLAHDYNNQKHSIIRDTDPDNRFSRLSLELQDNRKKPQPQPPDKPVNLQYTKSQVTNSQTTNRIKKESVNERIKRLKESGELQIKPYNNTGTLNKMLERPRSNTEQLSTKKIKTFEEDFPSLNTVISNSAPSTPVQNPINDRIIIQEIPPLAPKYVSIGLKNGKYFEREVYSIDEPEYVPEPRILVIKKPVYNKWTDLLTKRAESRVYVNSLRNVYDANDYETNDYEEKFEN